MTQRRFAAIGHNLLVQIARARALTRRRGSVAPLPVRALDPRVAFLDAETFTMRAWPGDRSGHVSPEWDDPSLLVEVTVVPAAREG